MPFDIVTFTVIHVLLSLVGIFAGLVVVGGLMSGRRLDGWIGIFLVTTVLTNVTGFGFPFPPLIASHYVAILSLLILPAVLYALYRRRLEGQWRRVFVIGTVLTLYLNVFVLVVQLFRRLPALLASAPKQTEPPFVIVQLLVLGMFAWLGRAALKGYPEAAMASRARAAA
jgi:uncharacterized membrane protein